MQYTKQSYVKWDPTDLQYIYFLFCTMTNKCTIISQISTLLHVLYIPGQHERSINIQIVYTATTQNDFMKIVATK